MLKSEEIPFQLIAKAGDARSYAYEALEVAKSGKFDEAFEILDKCETLLNEAHKVQFEIICQESTGGCDVTLSFLMVHAQDHLMTAILAAELIKEQIETRKYFTEKIENLK